jgi:hypothetical protein
MTGLYIPRGRAADVIDAMKAQPQKVEWTPTDLAEACGIAAKRLCATLLYCVQHRVVFKGGRGGRLGVRYSLRPFADSVPVSRDPHPKPAAIAREWRPDPTDSRYDKLDAAPLKFSVGSSVRPGAMDAYALPSCVGGQRIERTRAPIVLGSAVPVAGRR